MDDMTAIGIAEGFIANEGPEHEIQAWQHLIDTGLCWNLQGWFGRTAQHMIDIGACKPLEIERITAVEPKDYRTISR
tara:strand:+ start:1509 stop:1739 length:231 start_codon:yes stop_codon:yes gene_type:complete